MGERPKVIKTFQLSLTKDRFNEHLSLNKEFELEWWELSRIVSAKLVQYGNKELSRDFVDNGYIVDYSNKDRRCSMRFNIACAVGIVVMKNPAIDKVVIDFELEVCE